MTPAKKNRTPPPSHPRGAKGGGCDVLEQQIFFMTNLCHAKKVHDKVISNLLKSTKTIVLGLRKVSVTLFWSLVLLYVIDAVKSYEGLQDPTHN